ncbi:MAG: type I methionyl aminopeptidase [Clostridia bacterium]|nr:type I methionyl aminopeptidase [Clostridia bacterium]MBR3039016.1 type I methionyl aminopeptidase [Clostridia bacterium]
MITIKSAQDIERMRAAGRVVEETLLLLEQSVRIGITTAELDRIADTFIRSKGAYPTFLNYNGYPKSICISVNDEVVHGIPGKRKLKDGDIVSCDVGATLDGFVGDAARTFLIGNVPQETQDLVRITRECFFEGLKYCRVGYRISDISKAIQKHAESHGYGVVRELVGHGVGRKLHEDPEVPNYYSPRARQRLEAGMTIAVEPMINLGTAKIWQLDDGWTVTTQDGKPSAHYENSIAITDGDPILLTCSEAIV